MQQDKPMHDNFGVFLIITTKDKKRQNTQFLSFFTLSFNNKQYLFEFMH